MAKIDLNTVSSGYLSQAALNANFTAIEDEFQNKVLYRDNPNGEPNSMQSNLDMNGYYVLNAGNTSLVDADNIAYTPNGTGAETRTVSDKLNEVVSVKDFGAVGDGVTDDSAALQAFLDAGGGHIPVGNYLISTQLVLNQPNTTIIGDGSNLSKLLLDSKNNTNGVLKLIAENTSVASEWIRDINLKGFGIGTDGVATPNSNTIMLHVVNGYRIRGEDVEVRGGYKNIVFEGGATQHWVNLLSFADGFSYASPCECCVEIKSFTRADAYTQIPAEYSFSNFTFRTGSGVQGNVNYALKISAADGLWFSNGVTSFSKVANVYVTTDTTNLQWLYFNSVFSDCGGSPNFTPNAWHFYAPSTQTIQNVQVCNSTSRASTGYGFIVESTTQGKIAAFTVTGHQIALFKAIGAYITGVIHAVFDFLVSPPFTDATDGIVVANSNYYEIRGLINNQFSYLETPKTIPISNSQIDNVYVATNIQAGYADSANTSWVVPRLKLASGGMASSDVNTLDKYTESTFTPGIRIGTTDQTGFASRSGRATQIGDVTIISVAAVLNAITGTGTVSITGLTVTIANDATFAVAGASLAAGVGTAELVAIGFASGTSVNIYKRSGGSLTQLTDADLTVNSSFRITGMYHQ